jgi:hypothetical protein
MPEAVLTAKDPIRVRMGREAIRRRWGPRRWVYLPALDPHVANVIRQLVDAAEKAQGQDGAR